MYLQAIGDNVKTTTIIKIKYDCCGKEHFLKHKDATKNFEKNNKKHICRSCGLKTNNPASRPEVRAKMKQTCIERYGTEMPINSEDNIAARVEQMFGTESAVQEIVAKRKKTSQERYGTSHPMQNEDIKAKQQAVLQEKYGVPVPLQNANIKAKMQKTVQDKYGVANVAMLPEVRTKMAKTMYDNYGVEHYNQLPLMKEYLRENCSKWLQESWDKGGPNKDVPRPQDWTKKQRDTVLKLILEGKWTQGHKSSWRGYYTTTGKCKRRSSFFRSGFELMYHHFLDTSKNVEWYDYEPFAIRYSIDCQEHNYIPDFIVKFKDDDILHIREVKADYLHDSLETKAKYEAAKEFVRIETHMDYDVLLKGDIKALGVDFEKLKQQTNVVIIHDPTNK